MDTNHPILKEIIIQSENLAPVKDNPFLSYNALSFALMRKAADCFGEISTTYESGCTALINSALHEYTIFNSDTRNKRWQSTIPQYRSFMLSGFRQNLGTEVRAVYAVCTNDLSRYEAIFNLLNKDLGFDARGKQVSGKFAIEDKNLFNQPAIDSSSLENESEPALASGAGNLVTPRVYALNHESIYKNALEITEKIIDNFSQRCTPDFMKEIVSLDEFKKKDIPYTQEYSDSYNDFSFNMCIVPALIASTQQIPVALLDKNYQIELGNCGMKFLKQFEHSNNVKAIFHKEIHFLRETLTLCYTQGGIDILEALSRKAANSPNAQGNNELSDNTNHVTQPSSNNPSLHKGESKQVAFIRGGDGFKHTGT